MAKIGIMIPMSELIKTTKRCPMRRSSVYSVDVCSSSCSSSSPPWEWAPTLCKNKASIDMAAMAAVCLGRENVRALDCFPRFDVSPCFHITCCSAAASQLWETKHEKSNQISWIKQWPPQSSPTFIILHLVNTRPNPCNLSQSQTAVAFPLFSTRGSRPGRCRLFVARLLRLVAGLWRPWTAPRAATNWNTHFKTPWLSNHRALLLLHNTKNPISRLSLNNTHSTPPLRAIKTLLLLAAIVIGHEGSLWGMCDFLSRDWSGHGHPMIRSSEWWSPWLSSWTQTPLRGLSFSERQPKESES